MWMLLKNTLDSLKRQSKKAHEREVPTTHDRDPFKLNMNETEVMSMHLVMVYQYQLLK
ncbi:MAG: hypothetical protein NPIRA02_12000 [Nitrospirales bacterium]|nr:MAG: hypothetical protein NPIRA02_12000 [Nitrospirales bacterium]